MAVKKVFKATRKKYVPKLVAAYKNVIEVHRKGLSDESRYVLDELNLDSWTALADVLNEPFSSAQKDAAKRALTALGVTDKDLFDQVSKEAVAAAETRAAELVGMKWNGEELVPNPSADLAITESTREAIREMVVSALQNGDTVEEFASKLQDSFAFSDARAEMIARTEIGQAHVDGTLDAWRQSGLVEGKRWLVGTGEVCDECTENEDDGIIGFDEVFSSGDFAPLAHPHCVCVLVSDLLEAQ